MWATTRSPSATKARRSKRQSGKAAVHSSAMARVPVGSQGNVPPLTASVAPSAIRSSKRSKSRSFQAATKDRTISLFLSWSVVMEPGIPGAGRKFANFSAAGSILVAMEERSMDDAALATLARGGDAEALAGLLERYRPSLYAAAVRLLRDRDEAHDAVQETYLVALAKLDGLRDPAAVGGWLHAVLRNACVRRLRDRREAPAETVDPRAPAPGPEEVLDGHALADWLWAALARLSPEERVTVVLRHFTRCQSYGAVAAVTGVPVGTVRSRLHRARSELAATLRGTLAASPLSHATPERARRAEWEHFYAELHQAPLPRTYRDTYAPDVEVTDRAGAWSGVEAWSAHERDAIDLGVRATIVGLVAGPDHTILEIDFTNPAWADDHCPPRSTFVHRLGAGRSRRLDIHYV